jgi:hypothetical protein
MRKIIAAVASVTAIAALAVPTVSMAAGNSDNAHACQQGGWQNLVRQDGTGFSNTGDCVSYAANGGKLVAKAADTSVGGSENFSEDAVGSNPLTFAGGTIDPADYSAGNGQNAAANGGTGGTILASGPYFNGFVSGSHFLFTGWGQSSAKLTFTNPVKSVQMDVENNKTGITANITLTAYDAQGHVVITDTKVDVATGAEYVTPSVTSASANIKSVVVSTDENVDGVHYGLGFTNIVWS